MDKFQISDNLVNEKIRDILYIACNMGKLILQNGGETYRAEETIIRTCAHYGIKTNSFATLNTIITSTDLFENRQEDSMYTVVDRINFRTINLEKVSELNNLARNLNNYTIEELKEKIKSINNQSKIDRLKKVTGHVLAGGAFALLFKGGIRDSIVAIISMLLLSFFDKYLREKKLNSFFTNLVGAMFVTVITLIFYSAGFINDFSTASIAALMLLAPGISFTNSIRDIIAGDFISGISRGAEAVAVGVALAAGSGMILSILLELASKVAKESAGVIAFYPTYGENLVYLRFIKEILLAILATLGFGILFGIKNKKLFFASISGGLGWFFYIFALHINLSASIGFFFGSLSMTVYSEVMARKLKAPAITFLIGGLIPLVPGSGVYYTMYNLLTNEFDKALKNGVDSLLCAGAIGIGILIGSTLCQMFYSNIKNR